MFIRGSGSVRPQHLPCEQLLGETTNAPRMFPRGENTPFPRTCVIRALSLSKPSSQRLAPVLSAFLQKKSLKFFKKLNNDHPKLALILDFSSPTADENERGCEIVQQLLSVTGPKDTALNVHVQEGLSGDTPHSKNFPKSLP